MWSIIGWTLLGLLALLLLVLMLPAAAYIDVRDGELTVKFRILFIKLTLWPAKPKKEKPAKQRKQKKQAKETESTEKPKSKKTPAEVIAFVKRIASAAGVLMRKVLRHIRIKDIELVIPVTAEEAADVAINCGRLQALVGAARAVLEERMRLSYKRLVILPDFANQYQGSLIFSCKIMASPVIMLAAAIAAGIHFLRYKEVLYTRAEYLSANPPPRRRRAVKPLK